MDRGIGGAKGVGTGQPLKNRLEYARLRNYEAIDGPKRSRRNKAITVLTREAQLREAGGLRRMY